MGNYGDVAIRATALVHKDECDSPREAWQTAVRELFSGKMASQQKSCPRSAYLGLCEKGLVAGVRPGHFCEGSDNKGYAVEAVQSLLHDPVLAEEGSASLWRHVMNGRDKKPNGQMDVVLALWTHGLIHGQRSE